MDLELTDRVIIVTGASAGIGRATVELLAAEGAHVVGAARKPDDLDGPRVSAVPVDGSRGLRSNVVSPGPTRTRRWDAPGGFADQLAEQITLERDATIEHFVTEVCGLSLGRLDTPHDVARVIAFLLAPASAQFTGSEYAVDGGVLREI